MTDYKTHTSDAKKKVIKQFVKLINEYKVIAAVDVENLPAKQLNTMRANLRGKAHLLMTKRRLIKIALKSSNKEKLDALEPYLKGMPALLFSNENPFSLFKILKKSKSPAPIKAGQTAHDDIIVPAGPTSFAPGPIIGELGGLGIKAGIDAGKVTIKTDAKVAKEGDVISAKLAALLQRLEIYPVEIGLNLVAAYEDGNILTKKDLDIDEDAFLESIRTAASDAFLLTIATRYPTKENILRLIQNAHMDAVGLADSQSIMTADNVISILAKANAQAQALDAKVNK